MHADVVVAGHIAVDIIPNLSDRSGGLAQLKPGQLVEAGAAAFSSGGCVSNTGLALDRLGVPVRLIGCVGDDEFGELTVQAVRRANPELARSLQVIAGGTSSYTIVLNPPGEDRVFIHCPGVNHSFCSQHVRLEALEGARLLHFGYPPLMRTLYSDQGGQMTDILRKAHGAGIMTSLDMAMPGSADAEQVDWPQWLQRVLPEVDLFIPSYDELLVMLPWLRGLQHDEAVSMAAEQLLDWGCAIAAIKLGDRGIYCRTAPRQRLKDVPHGIVSGTANWASRELWSPCFQVEVVGTTGAGDCTIAGFIRGIMADLPIERVLQSAVAVGACSVEAKDALSGVLPWEQVQARMERGWPLSAKGPQSSHWRWDATLGLWRGGSDSTS